jgi:hypothetical protein
MKDHVRDLEFARAAAMAVSFTRNRLPCSAMLSELGWDRSKYPEVYPESPEPIPQAGG